MPPENLGFFETINGVLPYIGMAVVAIVAVVLFVWYTKKYTPEIARQFIKAAHNRGLPVFIQDEMGNVELQICDKKFPEGVVHVKGKGWFLLPNPPNPEAEFGALPSLEGVKRGPGRPPKNQGEGEVKEADEVRVPLKGLNEMSEAEKKAYVMAHGILVQTPILRGFGRQVFFGSSVSAALSNLTAIAHAELPNVRLLSPKMYQKTQLDALATGSRIEGLKMSRAETTKLLMYAIIAAVPIACFAIAAWLLTSHPAALAFLVVG